MSIRHPGSVLNSPRYPPAPPLRAQGPTPAVHKYTLGGALGVRLR